MLENNDFLSNGPTPVPSPDEMDEGMGLRKILSIVGLVLLVASIGTYIFYTRSLTNEYADVSKVLADKEKEITDIQAQIKTLKDSEQKMDITTEVQKTSLLKAIPVGMKQDNVIEDLIKIAQEDGVTLSSVSFGKSDPQKDSVGSLKINAGFQGDYGDLIHFLKGIEDNARLFKVTTINVQVSDVSGQDLKRVTFSLSIEAYYQ